MSELSWIWISRRLATLLAVVTGAVGCTFGEANTPLGSTIDPCTDPRSMEFLPPTRFTRETGQPFPETQAFSVPFDGQFCVTLVNGESDPPRGNRISSAEIDVDDSPLFGSDDINQRVEGLETSIALSEGDHLLNVLLASSPGSFVEVSIRGLPDPGIPFTASVAPGIAVPIPNEGEGLIEIEVRDVTDAPLEDIDVRLRVAEFPFESGGVFFADPLRTRFAYSAPGAPGPADAETDTSGSASFLADPRGLGLYPMEATLPDASWVSPIFFYIEAVPNPGRWFNHTGNLLNAPSARANPNMMFDPNRGRVLLFGGREPGGAIFNDLWELRLPADPFDPPVSWQPITVIPPGALPLAVAGTAAVYDPIRDRVVLMTSGPADELQVWAFDFDDPAGLDGSWTPLTPVIGAENTLPTTIPGALFAHSFGAAVHDPIGDRMIHFGGVTSPQLPPDFGFTSDVISFEFEDNVLAGTPAVDALTGDPIDPRSLPGAVFDVKRNRMIVYGGHFQAGDVPAEPTFLGDAWQGDFRLVSLGEWNELTHVAENPVEGVPADRRNFSFANDAPRERAVMYGGLGGPPADPRPATDEVWQMRYHEDGVLRWDRLLPILPGPTARDAHSAGAVFDLDSARMIVFGGIRPESGPPGDLLFDETWELVWDFAPIFTGQATVELDRWAVFNDRFDAAVLEVSKVAADDPAGTLVASAGVRLSPLFPIPSGGVVTVPGPVGPIALDDVTFVPLADDATRGDDFPGDARFHLGPITYSGPVETPLLPSTVVLEVNVDLDDMTTSFAVTTVLHAVEAGTVVTTTPVAALVPPEFTVRRSANVLFITDPFRLLFPSYRNTGANAAAKAVTSFAYLFLEDIYHWVTVMPTCFVRKVGSMQVWNNFGSRVALPPSNIGISGPAFEYGAQWCCGETTTGPCPLCTELLGASYINAPSPRIIEHEWGHTYGISFDVGGMTATAAGFDGTGMLGATLLDGGGHWSRYIDIHSLMGPGATILTVVPGTFNCTVVSEFHPYDLYLMGLVDQTALPPVVALNNATEGLVCDPAVVGTFDDLATLAAADLVSDNGGPRSPFPGVTAYNAAVIAVTPDASFTTAERAYFELLAAYMSSGPGAGVVTGGILQLPFSAATSSLATVDTTIVAP